jgi:4-amino-4-deoxy-L-arabinose transferase-like glycosyltransferase
MFHRLNHRFGHYLLLLTAGAALTLPNLGAPGLWDIDEGHNAEAAREMLDSGNWLVPTFNFQLRDHKPPLLYWLQIAAYEWFGVNEFAARLPSALAAIVAVLLTYELARVMFGPTAGLLAGLILGSAGMFCAAAHFANPDSLLNMLTLATFCVFLSGLERSSNASRLNIGWSFIPMAILMGLGVLTKGPVGLLLPGAVIGLFLLWSRQLSLLVDCRLAVAALVFILVAVPWYVWIASETKGEFTRGFFLTHNFGRFLSPMENHRGPIYYYLIVLFLGFAPWSPFVIPALFHGFWNRRNQQTERVSTQRKQVPGRHLLALCALVAPRLSYRFLASWIIVYLIFFSLSGTKLPNYILPIYPAVAILTGTFLECWRRGEVPRWVIKSCLAGLALVGIATSVGLVLASGVFAVRFLGNRQVPGLELWAWIGVIPVAGALLSGWLLRKGQTTKMLASLAGMAVLFVGVLATWGTSHVDAFKAPRPLVQEAGACQTDRDIRIACYQFYQPSLVFYCHREVRVLNDEMEVLEFLRTPLPIYLFVSAQAWENMKDKIQAPHRLLARHRDIYKGIDVLVITNENAFSAGQVESFSR